VSEKLAVFAAIYAKEAAADVESKKADIVERTEKLKKATELWTALEKESTDLGIADTFKAVFPQAGGDFIAVSGNAANPSLTNLLGYGGEFKARVLELSKLKRAKNKLDNAITYLEITETLAARDPEKYIDDLGKALLTLAASASGTGNSIDELLKSTFSTYEGFKEVMDYEITNTPGPPNVKSSQEAYEVLKDKFKDGTSSSAKTADKATVSPINEPPSSAPTTASPTNGGINLTSGAEPKGAENTTEGIATVTEGKPEIVKPEVAPQPTTNINLNLEKGPESPSPGASSNLSSQSVINTTNISTSLPSLEPAAASITQQTLDLSKNTTGPSSTINSQSVSQPTQTTGDTVSSASNSTVINEGPAPSANTVVENTTINQTSVEKDKKKPGFFKKALSKAGALLSPLLENTSESNRGISEMVKAKLNKVLPINSVNNVVNNDKKETNSANQLNLTESSTQIENNKTSVAAGDSTNTAVSTTTTQPIIDATIEKINPTVEGNATTATPDAKPEIPAPVITPTQSPTLTEIKEPSPAAAEKSPNQPSQPQRSSNPDFSSLEKRLKRIEIALTNPLEVIIKEH
jgi:hypothetical protein